MPELPEVETIRQDLAERVAGRCFTGVELLWAGCIDRPSPEEFAHDLPGKRIAAVERRGKYLIFRLDQSHSATGQAPFSADDFAPPAERRAVNDPASVEQSTLKGASGSPPTTSRLQPASLRSSRGIDAPAVAASSRDLPLKAQTSDLGTAPGGYLVIHLRM